MFNPRLRRIVLLSVAFSLGYLSLTAAPLRAQTDTGTDVRFHKFQPRVSPEVAAKSATDRSIGTNGISLFAQEQMRALQQEKESRTPAQRKIDSNLLYTMRMLQGQDAAPGVAFLETGVTLDTDNNMVVDIIGTVDDTLLARLSDAGATIVSSFPALHSLRAIIAPAKIEAIAALPQVTFLSPKQESDENPVLARPHLPASISVTSSALAAKSSPAFAARAERLRAMLAQQGKRVRTNASGTPNYGQGNVETEGDLAHLAVDARGTYGVTGAGLKIGVLSNGVATAATSQATGDLPPTCGTGVASPCLTVLSGQGGTGDEGTAMLEIVHDMVPGADLYFATAGNGLASFASNIRALQAAGCSIIVDDEFYYVETPFQNGQASTVASTTNGGAVIQAINDVVAAGAFYFTSAGNSGNLDSATSGTFEGDFTPMAAAAPLPTTGFVNNFGSGVGYDSVTLTTTLVNLYWADPLGASTNDYDLYLLNSAGTAVVASSTNIQSGTQDPYEQISSSTAIAAATRLVVYQKSGAANRFFHLSTNRGTLNVGTAGETHGHSGLGAAYSVAATPALTPYSASTPVGPYPGPFTAANKVETFSSDGLRRYFFNSDSTPVTAGNFSSSGGAVQNKPDITGADGVSVTGVGGFGSPFYGTSAAAPSAASVAALVLSAKPSITAAQMRTALTSTAVDIMGSGYDRDAGNGIVMALPAVQSLGVVGGANLEFGAITANEAPGNGDGAIEAGEGALLTVQLKNSTGVAAATGISATLTTSTAGVLIKQPAAVTYADLAAGAGAENGNTNFTFALSPNFGCVTTVQFALNITYSGGQTKTLSFSVPVGLISISNTLGATPTLVSGITFSTGTQISRVSRSGVASSCTASKTFPGAVTGANHVYDSYTFNSCSTGCVAPQVTAGTAGINLFAEAYTPNITSSNIATGYVADAGSSSATQSFGFNAIAGTSYSVVIADVNGNPPTTGIANAYSVQIPACAVVCSAYPLPVASVQNVTVTASAPGGTANASINNGSSDPNGGAITITQSPAGPYPVGTTAVILTITNKNGAFSQATANVTVLNPTTTVTVSPATINYGTANTTLSANVAYAGAQPTGTVTFQVDSGNIIPATCTAGSGSETCTASYSTGTLTVGSHTIKAVIATDSSYATGSGTATLTVNDTFASLVVSGVPSTVSPATAQTFTVRALGASGATFAGFTGTVTLTSTDPLATFSQTPYTFTVSDAGVRSFTATFNTAGLYSITATTSSVSGSQTGIRVGGYIWALSTTGALSRINESGSALSTAAGGQGTSVYGGVAFDAASQTFSVVSSTNAVTRTGSTGGAATTLTGGGLNAPVSVAVDGAGLIWVANSGNNSVSVFSGTTAVTPATGFGPASLTAPSALAIDASGGVWVTNRSTGTVTHLFGAATPVVTPLSNAAGNAKLGAKP